MTVRALVGLFVLNLAVLGIGAALLWGLGALRRWGDLVRLAGVAYLLGLSSAMVVLTLELVLGVPVTRPTSALSFAAMAAGGIALGMGRGLARPAWPRERRLPRISLFAALSVAGIVAYLANLFRAARLSSVLPEWDGWWFWIPKAKAIYHFGELDPGLLAFLPTPSPSYPPGLPAVHAVAFEAMGAADETTLHVQYWFYVLGFVAALVGVLGTRVRTNILLPLVLLFLLAPSLVTRVTWTYADLPLGYLVAVAALVLLVWSEERQTWQLAVATVLLSGATLTKREGILFAACVFFAAFAASVRDRRSTWRPLFLSGLAVFAVGLPWRIWFTANGLPSDAPSTGYLGSFAHLDRVWPSLQLVVDTLFARELWLTVPTLTAIAVVLASFARAWTSVLYTGTFGAAAVAAATWTIWSETSLPFTQDDALNPIVRMTGTTFLVFVALTPLLLDRAWSARSELRSPTALRRVGAHAFAARSSLPWAIVVLTALAFPVSMIVGYSGQTLPGGVPRFPDTSDCVAAPVAGAKVRFVVGYADSHPDARVLRRRAVSAGVPEPEVGQDGCGRIRVSIGNLATVESSVALLARARSAGLEPSLELDAER